MKLYKQIIFILALILILQGCVYFNTYYLAKKNFNEAENAREKTGKEIAAGNVQRQYQTAIDKCTKIITEHPDSKYVDDALFIIGKSYYHMGEFFKSERKFRELLAAYPDSKYSEAALFNLGKCRIQQEEYILARQDFIKIDSITKNKKWKAEAQNMLGEIEFKEENYSEAIRFYSSFLENYASSDNAAQVQYKIAEAYELMEDYESAKNSYLNVKEYEVDDSLFYLAQYNSGQMYYELGMIDSGFAIFDELSSMEKYYDKAGEIRLKLAEAMKMRGEFEEAINQYKDITVEFEKSEPAAVAYFQIGEILIREYNDLEQAQLMYDSSKTASRRSSVFQRAVERSADLSMLSIYKSEVAEKEDLEYAAESQYQLAELYLIQLENPDTALAAFQQLVDSFPETDIAARAYLAKGFIYENHLDNNDSARIFYQMVLDHYPQTDWVEDAAEKLNINLDTMNIDYPGRRYQTAEELIFDSNQIDSAMVVLQSIIDDFPNSSYAPKAGFAKAWLMEKYSPPEIYNPDDSMFVPDSTIIYAYQNVAEEFEGSAYGDSAKVKLGQRVTPKPKRRAPQQEDQQTDEKLAESGDSTQFVDADNLPIITGSSVLSASEAEAILRNYKQSQIEALIDTLYEIKEKPAKEGEFIYPPESYYSKFEGYVGFMLKVDFLGQPSDWIILQSSHIKEIDEAAEEAVRYTEFNVSEIPVEYQDQWMFYRIRVELPDEVKGFK